MMAANPVRHVAFPHHCGRIRARIKSGPDGAGNTVCSGPRHDLLGELIVTDHSISVPARVGDIIGPDPATWLAAIMRLPVDHVRAKLTAVRP